MQLNDSEILFAGLKLPLMDNQKALDELAALPEKNWIWDDYRKTYMLPLMTKDGLGGKDSLFTISTSVINYTWIQNCPPTIKDYFEQWIFTWIFPRPRIVVLKTPSQASLQEHIDCQRDEFGQRQIKFRYVLKGKVSSLYFVTQEKNVFAPEITTPFIIDGSWPHGMINDFTDDKITICVGAPWSGAEHYPEMHSIISKENVSLPIDYKKFFK